MRAVTDRYHLTEKLTSLAAALPGRIAGGAVGFFQRFIGTVASAATALVLTIYFMADLPRLRTQVVRLSPPARPRGPTRRAHRGPTLTGCLQDATAVTASRD